MKIKNLKVGLVATLCIIALAGGGYAISSSDNSLNPKTEEYNQGSSENISDLEDISNNDETSSTEKNIVDIPNIQAGVDETVLDCSSVPNYVGEPFIVINGGIPEFSENDKMNLEPFEEYSKLDNFGRCGVAYANICLDLMPTEERGSIGSVRPSGWHTVKYNDLIDGNYLYNRCHLIGYQLAGENANELNLITGTRYLNMVGMLEFENTVCDYVKETENHVLYRVTPWFKGANLVADGVQIEAWSVEDSGKGICFNVYCYNVQPGIEIDYSTGESWVSSDSNDNNDKADVVNEEENHINEIGASVEQEIGEYVLNKNTKKFHLPTCSSVEDMSEKNKEVINSSIDEIKGDGYTPCARCLGEYR